MLKVYIIAYTKDDGKGYTTLWCGKSKEDAKETFKLWSFYEVDYVEEYIK